MIDDEFERMLDLWKDACETNSMVEAIIQDIVEALTNLPIDYVEPAPDPLYNPDYKKLVVDKLNKLYEASPDA